MKETYITNKMNKQSLISKFKDRLLVGVLAGYIGLLGCGGGGGPNPPPPPKPSYSQTATLARDIDLEYGAKFANMNNPVRSITHDGAKFGDDLTLPASPYSETLGNLRKGSYAFTLRTTTPGVFPISLTKDVPNYDPTFNSSGLETTLRQRYEGSSITLCIEDRLLDKNPEDRPVTLNSVGSLDGLTTVSRSGDSCFTISANGTSGLYQVGINFGSDVGGHGSGVISGEILTVPEQILSQAVSLFNDVDINYGATLTNVASATRTITRDGNPFGSLTTITTSPYTEIFDDMRKGNYSFRLEASGDSVAPPHAISLEVPNYPPEANFTSLDTNLEDNEGTSKIFNLESLLSDKNPEDRSVPLISATTLSGDVTAERISDHEVKVTATGEPGSYQVRVTFGSEEGGVAEGIIQGDVFDHVHLTGQLQDARTNTLELRAGESGTIHVYNAADNTFLKEYLTDSQGNFDFKLDQQGISQIFLQARIDAEIPSIGIVDGFVRTIKIPGRDATNILIRAYPYNEILANAGILKPDFRRHLEEINPFLFKSKVDNIEIIDVNPLGRGSFTPEFMDLVKNKILNPNDIGCYVDPVERGRPLNVQIDDLNSIKHYHVEGNEIIPDRGWGIFVRDTTLQGAHATTFNEYMFRISTRPCTEQVAAHEFGHVFIAPWHHALTLLAETQTIMRATAAARLTPGPGDCEAGKVVYESTYELQEGETIRIEPYSNTLGLGFCVDSLEFCPQQ